MDRTLKCDNIPWKSVGQYFTMVLFIFQFYPVCNLGKFINFGLGRSERVCQNHRLRKYPISQNKINPASWSTNILLYTPNLKCSRFSPQTRVFVYPSLSCFHVGSVFIHSDEGLTPESLVFESFTVANLPHRPCG